MRFIFLLLVMGQLSFAQSTSQPEKESTQDLRSGIVMFSIENTEDDKIVWLERTASLDYFLRMTEDDDEEKIHKLSSKEAKALDMEFASKFLKCQYELPPSPEGCKVTLHLNMKGEKQGVCAKDDKKAQEIQPFLKALLKRF
jgi:hypothetical protein